MKKKAAKRSNTDPVDTFRSVALSMPGAVERSHMGHPDFRSGGPKGKIFASLLCSTKDVLDEDCGMVKLTPDQQHELVAKYPDTFCPIKGTWGLRGCTRVNIALAKKQVLKQAILLAWSNLQKPARAKGL